jgi:hypothetical protein
MTLTLPVNMVETPDHYPHLLKRPENHGKSHLSNGDVLIEDGPTAPKDGLRCGVIRQPKSHDHRVSTEAWWGKMQKSGEMDGNSPH